MAESHVGTSSSIRLNRTRVHGYRGRRLARRLTPYLLISPIALVVIFVTVYPTIYSFWLSFTQMKPKTGQFYFVGLQNFFKILPSGEFLVSLRVSLIYASFYVVLTVVFGYMLALMFNRRVVGSSLYMTLIFIPWVLSEVISGLTWRWMFNPQLGIVELALKFLHLTPSAGMINNPSGARAIMVAVSLWRFVAYIMILLLAGLQAIPEEIHESARVDGVNRWKEFWNITFPLMRPTTLVAVLLLTIGALNYVGMFLTITNGGPVRETEVLSLFLYHEAFGYFNLGNAATISVMLLLVNLLLAFFYIRVLRSEKVY